MAQTDLAVKWMIGSTKKTGPIGGTHVVRRICLVPDHFRCAQICDFCLFVIHTERGLRCEANLFCTKCNSFSAKLRWFSTVSTVYIYIYMIHIFILKIPEGCPFSYCHTFQKPWQPPPIFLHQFIVFAWMRKNITRLFFPTSPFSLVLFSSSIADRWCSTVAEVSCTLWGTHVDRRMDRHMAGQSNEGRESSTREVSWRRGNPDDVGDEIRDLLAIFFFKREIWE